MSHNLPTTNLPPRSVFLRIIEIVEHEYNRFQCDIDDLEPGEVLPPQETHRLSDIVHLRAFVRNLESIVSINDGVLTYAQTAPSTAGSHIGANFSINAGHEGKLLDELVAGAIEHLHAEIEQVHHEFLDDEVEDEVMEACQIDGEDQVVVASSLSDLHDDTDLPDHLCSELIMLENIVRFMVESRLVPDEGSLSIDAMRCINDIIV